MVAVLLKSNENITSLMKMYKIKRWFWLLVCMFYQTEQRGHAGRRHLDEVRRQLHLLRGREKLYTPGVHLFLVRDRVRDDPDWDRSMPADQLHP